MRRTTTLVTLQLLLLLSSVSLLFGGKPEWVLKRPIVPDAYVGIGMMHKSQPASAYAEAAKNIALNDIASQITVTISSDVLRKVLETQEALADEFQSNIRASAKADLEGVELLDTYEDDDEYWVYLRIAKSEYEARRAAKMRNAVAIAQDLALNGRRSEHEGNVAHAFGFYGRTFIPLEKYLSEPVEAQLDGKKVLLVNEMYNSLQSLLGRLDVTSAETKIAGKIGRPLKKSLDFSASLGGASKTPVANLPFTVRFTRGSGSMVDHILTDRNGRAAIDVQKITSPERIQTIEAKMDLHSLLGGDTLSPVVQTLLSSFTLPKLTFTLNVSGVDVFVEANESMFGQKLTENRIEPILKSSLGEQGFAFVNDKSQASLAISLTAEARKGSELRGLAFAFASATVSVYDLETNREVFKSSVEEVKQGSNSFEKAAYKGFQVIAEKLVDELMPRLVQKIQQ
ncbi:MAG: LPP20 family lipoprotein [Ignavibacteriae bacterium]|nr:LPP20 family lipoprotein [Ignavibacteriota bacterium]